MSTTTFIYLGIAIGIAVAIWAIRAVKKRKSEPPVAKYDDYLDQTCELNYKPDEN